MTGQWESFGIKPLLKQTVFKEKCTFCRARCINSCSLHAGTFITMWQSHSNFPLCKRNHSMSRSQKQFIEVRASSTNEITESCERSQSKGDRVKQMQFYLFCQRDGARAQIKINFFQTAQWPRAAPLGARIFWFVIGESGSVGQVAGGGEVRKKLIQTTIRHRGFAEKANEFNFPVVKELCRLIALALTARLCGGTFIPASWYDCNTKTSDLYLTQLISQRDCCSIKTTMSIIWTVLGLNVSCVPSCWIYL